MGKIIDFPTPNNYWVFILNSAEKLEALITALNLANNQHFLSEQMFYHIVEYAKIDIDKDFTEQDRNILRFHCENYYNLKGIL